MHAVGRRETKWRGTKQRGPTVVFSQFKRQCLSTVQRRGQKVQTHTRPPVRDDSSHPLPFPLPFLLYTHTSFIFGGVSFILSVPFPSPILFYYRVLDPVICDPRLPFSWSFDFIPPGCASWLFAPIPSLGPGLPTSKRPGFARPFCCAKITDETLNLHFESVPDTVNLIVQLKSPKIASSDTGHSGQ